jgi:hypothetical protein
MDGHQYEKPRTLFLFNQSFGNGIKRQHLEDFFVLTQANSCITWVLGDQPVFGDEPIYPNTISYNSQNIVSHKP